MVTNKYGGVILSATAADGELFSLSTQRHGVKQTDGMLMDEGYD